MCHYSFITVRDGNCWYLRLNELRKNLKFMKNLRNLVFFYQKVHEVECHLINDISLHNEDMFLQPVFKPIMRLLYPFFRYALTQAGIQLGEKLDEFHNSFHSIQAGDLPELPDMSPEW